ncbi:hypothetical protein MW887_008611 [Aspergillus wentii]|nr:hypothetical protein MW887_008611 [Aspergillus wentii]
MVSPLLPGGVKSTRWTLDEDASIVAMRQAGENWKAISKALQGWSATACALRYASLQLRPEWNEAQKDQVAYWYTQLKQNLWSRLAAMVGLSISDVEALAWQLGQREMASRAARLRHGTNGGSTSCSTSTLDDLETRSPRFEPDDAENTVIDGAEQL